MKLKLLMLQNFRCFEEFRVQFHPLLTVFVSENGGGKTTILEAINISCSRLATKLIRRDGKSITNNDFHIKNHKPSSVVAIALSIEYQNKNYSLFTLKGGGNSGKKKMYLNINIDETLSDSFNLVIDKIIKLESENLKYQLPLIRYYGTNRVFLEEVARRTDFRKQFTRFEAFEGAFGAVSNFRAIYERFDYFERLEHEGQRERKDFDYELRELQVVREAVRSMLPGFENPRTELKPLQFVIDQKLKNGEIQKLRLSQLSDGFRTMLALTIDLALRMSQANPFSETGLNPLHQEAIIIIDEIDLHLHPIWQQRILGDLRRTFPQTQFIVSTHSPQVLTTVPAESIRIIDDNKVYTPSGTEGAESNRILKRIFQVDPRPQNNSATKELVEYLRLVHEDKWDDPRAKKLRKILNKRYNGEEPALYEADLYIENRIWEQNQ
jgi:predicted ATP-binding protein involved in virulence